MEYTPLVDPSFLLRFVSKLVFRYRPLGNLSPIPTCSALCLIFPTYSFQMNMAYHLTERLYFFLEISHTYLPRNAVFQAPKCLTPKPPLLIGSPTRSYASKQGETMIEAEYTCILIRTELISFTLLAFLNLLVMLLILYVILSNKH